jgi:uncharacterized membrane protein YGL010W
MQCFEQYPYFWLLNNKFFKNKMKSLDQWLSEYGESHQNPTNKLVHWFCVPIIYWTVVALLYSLKLPEIGGLRLNAAMIVSLLVVIYYALLSIPLSAGMLLFTLFCLYTCHLLETNLAYPLWGIALFAFVLAWIGQFWGHKVEGKKPSFIKDIQFLMIGPAWVMSFLFRKAGLKV